jgi:hypothetical protein
LAALVGSGSRYGKSGRSVLNDSRRAEAVTPWTVLPSAGLATFSAVTFQPCSMYGPAQAAISGE